MRGGIFLSNQIISAHSKSSREQPQQREQSDGMIYGLAVSGNNSLLVRQMQETSSGSI
jgi:hypothetical protein